MACDFSLYFLIYDMNRLDILGTRISIVQCDAFDFGTTYEESKKSGYNYSEAVMITGKDQMTHGHLDGNLTGFDKILWLRRETKVSRGKPAVLSDQDYMDVLWMSMYYVSEIIASTFKSKKSYYHGVLESLICFSGDTEIIDAFYDTNQKLVDLRRVISAKIFGIKNRTVGVSQVKNQDYRRYDIRALIKDLVDDGAEVIMDDSVYKYKWFERTTEGFGKIKPILTESEPFYPKYKITGIQGNQTKANLSLKFDFRATYDSGTDIKITNINRNLTLVRDGQNFQDYLALHVSPSLKKSLTDKGLVESQLPGTGDILVKLSNIPVSARHEQANKILNRFMKNVCLYKVTKEEIAKIESCIQWTQEEITKAHEKSEASRQYWAMNNSSRTSSSTSSKRIYIVSCQSTFKLDPAATQEELRNLLGRVRELNQKVYREVCDGVYGFLCSKKSLHEYFGIKVNEALKFNSLSVTEPETGFVYKCNFKFV